MRKIWSDDAWENYEYRQIQDKKNRIVFRITDEGLEIAQCGSHYGDK